MSKLRACCTSCVTRKKHAGWSNFQKYLSATTDGLAHAFQVLKENRKKPPVGMQF